MKFDDDEIIISKEEIKLVVFVLYKLLHQYIKMVLNYYSNTVRIAA